MTRTTPPRPVDITSAIPELAPYARTVLRLHPRIGNPTVTDNSVGGPLLWPVDESWPTCGEEHGEAPSGPPVTISGVRRLRELMHGRWVQGRELTDMEFREVEANQSGEDAAELSDERPTPLLPILQLYLRDAHGVVDVPDGADLLQVLWCPFTHEPDGVPKTSIHWRRAAEVDQVLVDPPQPVILEEEDFLPEMCVLHPEPVTEYPAQICLPKELSKRLDTWEAANTEAGHSFNYRDDLSIAPGWKLGGWPPVSFRDICGDVCECGAEMRPFLYIDASEWTQGETGWIPLEEYDPVTNPAGFPLHLSEVGVTVHGDGMQVYTCPISRSHPQAEWNQ
jgi:hypothetical protein